MPDYRLHEKRSHPPGLIPADLPMESVEGIRGVAEIISCDQSASAEVHGHTPEMKVGSQRTSAHVVQRQGTEQLENIEIVNRRRVSEISGILIQVRSCILPFEKEPKRPAASQSDAHPRPKGDLRVWLSIADSLIGSPGIVVRLKASSVFEAEVQSIGQVEH